VTSALIADTATGDFSIQAPSELGIGDHEVYVQAIRQKDDAMSKNIRVAFHIGAAEFNALNPSAPEAKGAGGGITLFIQRQGRYSGCC